MNITSFHMALAFLGAFTALGFSEDSPKPLLWLKWDGEVKDAGRHALGGIVQGSHVAWIPDGLTDGISSARFRPDKDNDPEAAIQVPSNEKFNLKDFSVVAWYRPASIGLGGKGGTLYDRYDAEQNGGIRIVYSWAPVPPLALGKIRFFCQINKQSVFTPFLERPVVLGPQSEWLFTALTYSSVEGKVRSYFASIEGGGEMAEAETFLRSAGEPYPVEGNATIGFRRSASCSALHGELADFRLYDRALSKSELNDIRGEVIGKTGKKKVVLLIGDSIRMLYAPFVEEALRGKAKVVWPPENCIDSPNILSHWAEWVEAVKPDIVHINCGLHDIKKNRQTGKNQVALEDYRRNLAAMAQKIRQQGGTVVWATTTPVIDDWANAQFEFERHDADVQSYNRIAETVMREQGASIDDLYAVLKQETPSAVFQKDGVHMTDRGSRLLAQAVARQLKAALNQ